MTNPNFVYNENKPSVLENWMQKANIGILERWQKRIFRLQGRAIFYFKKEKGEPPVGNIPLIDIVVSDLPPKKGRNFAFSIQIQSYDGIAKRGEYLISADSEEMRESWKKAIVANSSQTIVGRPLSCANNISFRGEINRTLVPYFIPPVLKAVENYHFRTRGIWCTPVPEETINKMMLFLNENIELPLNDINAATAGIIHYFQQLPESILPPSLMYELGGEITPQILTEKIMEQSAPVRQILKVLGLHFNHCLSASAQNGLSIQTIANMLGNCIIRQPEPNPVNPNNVTPTQAKSIQDKVVELIVNSAPQIFADIHKLSIASRAAVIHKKRLLETVSGTGDDTLEGIRGLLVNVVNVDFTNWCTAYTSQGRAGLIHNTLLRELTSKEVEDLKEGLDQKFEEAREKAPEFALLFDGMMDELNQLNSFFTT